MAPAGWEMDRSRVKRKTYDCEQVGLKHSLYIHSAQDLFLGGQVNFECYSCYAKVIVDRFWFYMAISVKEGAIGD